MINNILKEVISYVLKFVIIAVAVIVIYQGALWAYDSAYELMAREPEENITIVNVDVSIPQGSNTETIATILHEKGLINSVVYFRLIARINGLDDTFQYGDYTFNTGMTEDEIMTILATEGEKREVVTFTIPEGYTLEQVADKLAAEGIVTKSEFNSALENGRYGYKFLDYIPDRNLPLQGYVFPDTYEVYADATAEDIISTMLKRFDQVFKDEYYDRLDELGMTLDEVITIASIIEREVRVPDERATVSGVIYNRLEEDMKLEMCSTIMYVLDVPRDRVLFRDLEIESPYNTYKYSGLPIGPIANPGEASIIAALYPEEHNYLFFVLVDPEEGRHEFNVTYNDHLNAMNKYDQDF